jgi:hypothetical protein
MTGRAGHSRPRQTRLGESGRASSVAHRARYSPDMTQRSAGSKPRAVPRHFQTRCRAPGCFRAPPREGPAWQEDASRARTPRGQKARVAGALFWAGVHINVLPEAPVVAPGGRVGISGSVRDGISGSVRECRPWVRADAVLPAAGANVVFSAAGADVVFSAAGADVVFSAAESAASLFFVLKSAISPSRSVLVRGLPLNNKVLLGNSRLVRGSATIGYRAEHRYTSAQKPRRTRCGAYGIYSRILPRYRRRPTTDNTTPAALPSKRRDASHRGP